MTAAAPVAAANTRTSAVADGHDAVISCENLVRIFKVADLEAVALQGLDLRVQPSEMVAIIGASGSGKSTLLNILAGLDVPSAGRAVVAGHDLGRLKGNERTLYRRRVVGMIWQETARNLLPYLSAVENVEMPMSLDGKKNARQRGLDLLNLVGLSERANLKPKNLSGGEQQRVAIATALANEPAVLLGDEPTGELDSRTSSEVFDVLRRANDELQTTVVIVTHDALVTERVERTVAIRDGRTSSVTMRRTELHEGEHRVIAEEFAVLDRAGRLQLPRAHIEALDLHDRVRLRLEDDHVGVFPYVTHKVDNEGAEPAPQSGPAAEAKQ